MVNEAGREEEYDCSDSIMDCIKSGRARMKARWLVLVEEMGLKTSWILLVLFLIAVINLDLFVLSRGPQWEFMDFGSSGLGIVLKHFPYGWVAFGLLLMLTALYLMKRFEWSYSYPFKIFALLLFLGVFALGGITYATGINDSIYQKLVEEPGAGNTFLAKMYCKLANRELKSTHALRGEIMHIEPGSLVIQTPGLNVFTVEIDQSTRFLDREPLRRFDYIKMIGKHDGGVFVASMIKRHEYSEDFMPLRRSERDCVDRKEWEHKQQVAQQRRHIVEIPMTPAMGAAELIRSIY